MFKKIFKTTTLFVISIFIASSTLFSLITPVEAAQLRLDPNKNNSTDITIDESDDTTDNSMTSSAPDLGDDQAFPFIPGFGKNSGKD